MQAAVSRADYPFAGDLLLQAEHEAHAMRSLAATSRDEHTRAARLRLAALIDELITYARDRDVALASKVHECAVLRMRLEAEGQ